MERPAIRGALHNGGDEKPGAFAYIDLLGACRLYRETSATLGRTSSVLVFVRLQLGQPLGPGRRSPNVLCVVSADRSAGRIRQSGTSSARHAPSFRDQHSRAMVPLRSGSRQTTAPVV